MRPKAAAERGQPTVVSISGENQVTVEQPTSTVEKMGVSKQALSRSFTYDRAFGDATSQEQLFNATVAPVVDEVMKGFSCTVFAYGQTGTGKSYTMEGPKRPDGSVDTDGAGAGIIPRAIKRIFAGLPVRFCAAPRRAAPRCHPLPYNPPPFCSPLLPSAPPPPPPSPTSRKRARRAPTGW